MALSSIFAIAGSALTAQSQRMNVAASNLANIDSMQQSNGQPYRARQVVFQFDQTPGQAVGGVKVAQVLEDQSPFIRRYAPNNPLADAQGYISMPNVNPVDEMVNMIAASRSYQANLEVLNTERMIANKTIALGQA